MKAMVLTGIGNMVMRDVPDPVLRHSRDVLIEMSAVGVCGSDIHYYLTGRIGSQVVKYPFAVGHEGAGVVVRTGRGVKHMKAGDRVAIEPAMSCFKCDQCLAGRHHTCRKLRFLGCPGQAPGCLSEYIVMPEECCYPVKPRMSFEHAALAEPLSIGIYSVKQAAAIRKADIAVLGSGPIGLSVLFAAKAAGCSRVFVTDKIPERLSMARKAGADWAGNPDKKDVVAGILGRVPKGVDIVFECCGQQEALDQAVELLKPGGKLMVVGIPTVDRISFPIDKMRRKEICIQNVRRQVDCMQPALDLISRGRVDAGMMVTHRFTFDQSKNAFDLVAGYRDGVVKAMISFP